MSVGDLVRWSGKYNCTNIGIVLSYCDFQDLWSIQFPDGRYEIEQWCLEVISESG